MGLLVNSTLSMGDEGDMWPSRGGDDLEMWTRRNSFTGSPALAFWCLSSESLYCPPAGAVCTLGALRTGTWQRSPLISQPLGVWYQPLMAPRVWDFSPSLSFSISPSASYRRLRKRVDSTEKEAQDLLASVSVHPASHSASQKLSPGVEALWGSKCDSSPLSV